MATRQYIGARYVPKFYENGNGSAEWTANTAYEPLTIVTRNGNSYTSKKAVPATAGAPEAAPEYWASTGIYNQQIDVYREEVAEVAERMTAVESDLSLIKNRRFIFMGDSWYHYTTGASYTHFMDMVYSALNLQPGTDYYELASGGYGFIGDENLGRTWLSLLQAATIASPETITDIYVFGGVNDRPYTYDQITTAIGTFCNYCKTNFPNATVHIGCISWTAVSQTNRIIAEIILPAYRNCSQYGAQYIENMEYSAHIYAYLNGIHPTEEMQPYLFRAAMSAILYGYADVHYISAGSGTGSTGNVPAAEVTLESAYTYGSGSEEIGNNLLMTLDNNIVNITCAQPILIDVANQQLGDAYRKIATINKGLVLGRASGKAVHIPISCFTDAAVGRMMLGGFLLICNSANGTADIYIRLNCALVDTTALRILEFSGSYPTLLT